LQQVVQQATVKRASCYGWCHAQHKACNVLMAAVAATAIADAFTTRYEELACGGPLESAGQQAIECAAQLMDSVSGAAK
jgi:hypothetical protein